MIDPIRGSPIEGGEEELPKEENEGEEEEEKDEEDEDEDAINEKLGKFFSPPASTLNSKTPNDTF